MHQTLDLLFVVDGPKLGGDTVVVGVVDDRLFAQVKQNELFAGDLQHAITQVLLAQIEFEAEGEVDTIVSPLSLQSFKLSSKDNSTIGIEKLAPKLALIQLAPR